MRDYRHYGKLTCSDQDISAAGAPHEQRADAIQRTLATLRFFHDGAWIDFRGTQDRFMREIGGDVEKLDEK